MSTSPANGNGQSAKAAAIGSLSGGLGSLLGLGGGIVAIPAMTAIGLTQHQATGCSLGAVFATGLAGAIGFSAAGHVDWVAAGTMAVPGVVASLIGVKVATIMTPTYLKASLGFLMIACVPAMYFKDEILASKKEKEVAVADSIVKTEATTDPMEDTHALSSREAVPTDLLLKIGACTGFLQGIFGIGGGIVTVPALALFTDFTHHQCLGTSLGAMILPAVVGGFQQFRQGNLILSIAVPLALGTTIGAYIGSNYIANHISDDKLKAAFQIFMILMGGRTVKTALWPAIGRITK